MIDKINQSPNKLLQGNNVKIPRVISSTYSDKESGFTLLGGNSGVYKFVNNEFELISNIPKYVKSIIKFEGNKYWLGTEGGICLIDIETKKTKLYPMGSALNSAQVNAMIKSNSNDLWIGNVLGVSKFDIVQRKYTHYTYKNGFIDNEFINPAVVKGREGRLFFGGLKGVLAFSPDEIKEPEDSKEVVFTNMLINHQPIGKEQHNVSER